MKLFVRFVSLATLAFVALLNFHACQANDIVVIGVVTSGASTASNGDAFAWVPLVDLIAGEQIHFTDTGYFDAGNGGLGAWSTNPENTLTFTVPAGGITAGTVQTVGGPLNDVNNLPINPNYTLPVTSAYGTGTFALSQDGDQLLAFRDADLNDFEGAGYEPLFAVNLASNGFNSTSTNSAGSTNLYPGLTEGINAVAVGSGSGPLAESDLARYIGITTGSVNQIRAAVSNPANWEIIEVGTAPDPSNIWASNGVTQFNFGSPLTLEVNSTTGFVKITNDGSVTFDIDFYRIESATDDLDFANWNSLSDQGYDAIDGPDPDSIIGNGIGETWDQAGGSDDGVLSESFLLSSSVFNPSESVSLGKAFRVGGDVSMLTFQYRDLATGAFVTGEVVEVTGVDISADFDGDLDVDGADFLVWQRGFGLTGQTNNSNGDADGNGTVNSLDLAEWQNQYGAGTPLASNATAIPEPISSSLLAIALVALNLGNRKPRISRAG